jgi:hypothetical protein
MSSNSFFWALDNIEILKDFIFILLPDIFDTI